MSGAAIFFLLFIASGLSLILALLGLETLSTNLLGWVLLALGIAYPAGVIILYYFKKEPFWQGSGKAVKEDTGDRSFWAILPGMLVAFFVSPLEKMYLAWLPDSLGMQLFGLALIVCGAALHAWARRSIGDMYSGHLEVTAGQILVMSGPYHYVRHPGYAAFALMSLGIAIGYASLIGLAAIPLLLLPGLAYRIRVEEGLMQAYFGDAFQAYACQVKKLIPGIW